MFTDTATDISLEITKQDIERDINTYLEYISGLLNSQLLINLICANGERNSLFSNRHITFLNTNEVDGTVNLTKQLHFAVNQSGDLELIYSIEDNSEWKNLGLATNRRTIDGSSTQEEIRNFVESKLLEDLNLTPEQFMRNVKTSIKKLEVQSYTL